MQGRWLQSGEEVAAGDPVLGLMGFSHSWEEEGSKFHRRSEVCTYQLGQTFWQGKLQGGNAINQNSECCVGERDTHAACYHGCPPSLLLRPPKST